MHSFEPERKGRVDRQLERVLYHLGIGSHYKVPLICSQTVWLLRTSLTGLAERLQADHFCGDLKPQLVLLLPVVSVPDPGLA